MIIPKLKLVTSLQVEEPFAFYIAKRKLAGHAQKHFTTKRINTVSLQAS